MSSRRLILHPGPSRPLRDLLLAEGVEFPCGGDGTCGDCKVRVIEGTVPVTPAMRDFLTEDELAAGWRLGCCAFAEGVADAPVAVPIEVEVRQWQTVILGDNLPLNFEPRTGFGAAVDLGTTTVVVQCVDLSTGAIVGAQSALNDQARYGADVMTRIQHGLTHPGVLSARIREQIGAMLLAAAEGREVDEMLIAGNTVMHHLFCGEDVEPLASVPFRSGAIGSRTFAGAELGWEHFPHTRVTFLPCIGGFVGSDLLVGLLASGLADAGAPEAMFDLGTNGEIAVSTGERIFCASTAAGPAFEGGRISCGMRAGPGAIHHVELDDGQRIYHVIGGGAAQGICGSGLLDAVACAMDSKNLFASGRLRDPNEGIPLTDGLRLTQRDIRELQLAKGAVASGLKLLEEAAGVAALERIHLAGAFGNYVREGSARRTGLLPEASGLKGYTVHAAGNTALRGARLLLLRPGIRERLMNELLARITHVELAAQPGFQDAFVDSLAFPESA